jgi:hypothetical protein
MAAAVFLPTSSRPYPQLGGHAHILNKYPNRQAFIHLISTRSMALDIDPFHKFCKQNTLTTTSPQHDGQRIARSPSPGAAIPIQLRVLESSHIFTIDFTVFFITPHYT